MAAQSVFACQPLRAADREKERIGVLAAGFEGVASGGPDLSNRKEKRSAMWGAS